MKYVIRETGLLDPLLDEGNDTQLEILKSIGHVMCLLHCRQWDFKSTNDLEQWLVSVLLTEQSDLRRRPGPTQTIRSIVQKRVIRPTANLQMPQLWASILDLRPDVEKFVAERHTKANDEPFLRLVFWFFNNGISEYHLRDYVGPVIDRHFRADGKKLASIWRGVWIVREDLRDAFDLSTAKGTKEYQAWLGDGLAREYPALAKIAAEISQQG
ncbi:MAG: hypothetical protein KI792_09335 [Alphaproteobacteria bacterium]|nr:hypothetical protein [Alphaproteobacteria bacterium SS10]